jgi:hypothetical protein
MKFLKTFLLSLSVVFLFSCGSSQKVINSWINKETVGSKKYSKAFVIVLTENQTAKNIIESDLALTIKKIGLDVVKSGDVFPSTFSKENAPSKEAVHAKVKELNCDIIFTVSLLDSKTETRYVPGSIAYSPYPYYRYYGGFGPYYNYYSPTVYSSGYYTTDKVFYIEGNLFDSESEKILWSVQSETYNPSSIKEFSAGYCKLLVYQAQDDGLLK